MSSNTPCSVFYPLSVLFEVALVPVAGLVALRPRTSARPRSAVELPAAFVVDPQRPEATVPQLFYLRVRVVARSRRELRRISSLATLFRASTSKWQPRAFETSDYAILLRVHIKG